jgi:hypothetical protein
MKENAKARLGASSLRRSLAWILIFHAAFGASIPVYANGGSADRPDDLPPKPLPIIQKTSPEGAIDAVRVEAQSQESDKDSLEIVTTAPIDASQVETAKAWAKQELAKDAAKGVQPQVVVQGGDPELVKLAQEVAPSGAKIRTEAPAESVPELRNSMGYRIMCTVARGSLVGLGSFAMMVWWAKDKAMTPLEAAPVSIVSALMSGSLQFFTQPFYRFLTAKKTFFRRWLLTEIDYLSIDKAVMGVTALVLGTALPTESSAIHELLNYIHINVPAELAKVMDSPAISIPLNGLMGMWGQGFLDGWNITKQDVQILEGKKSPVRIAIEGDARAVLISTVAMGIAIANLRGIPGMKAGLLALGAVGLGLYLYEKRKKSHLERRSGRACKAAVES